MSRLLFLFAIAAVIYLLLKSFRKNSPPKTPGITEDMVRCAHCGVHIPVSESLHVGDQFYCSAAHRDTSQK